MGWEHHCFPETKFKLYHITRLGGRSASATRMILRYAWRWLLKLTLTGQALPYATLMYVWEKHRASGSVDINSRTDRIRKLVVESGPQQLGRWLDDERDSMRTTKSVSG